MKTKFLCLASIACLLFLVFSTASGQSVTVPPTPGANDFTDTLNSVCILNNPSGNTNDSLKSFDAWAVGQAGPILHWTGQNWSEIVSPTSNSLNSIYMVNSTSGWAVGGSLSKGIILYFDGKNWTEWKQIFNPTTNNATITLPLNSVAFDGTGKFGWAVGPQGSMYTWSNGSWTGTPQMNVTLHAISIPPSSSDAWVVGDNGTILRWNGSVWGKINSNTISSLRTIAMVNTTDGWIAGGDGNVGTLLSLNSTGVANWTRISFTPSSANDKINTTLNSISFATPYCGWVVGGGGWMLQWNGSIWLGQTGKTPHTLNSVSMPQNVTSAAWAVGDSGTILAWDGSQWAPVKAMDIPEIPTILIILVVFAALSFLIPKAVRSKLRGLASRATLSC